MDKKKTKVNKNFTKLTHKGVSLIVLIVTIIVIVILAATVILTLSKNNPIESAREARFKEDIRMFQDELNMYIASEYTKLQGQRDKKITALEYTEKGDKNSVYTYLSSFTKKYENKIGIKEDEIVYVGLDEKEREWLINSGIYMAKKITVHYKDGYGNSLKESEEYPMLDVKYHFEAPEIEGYMALNEIEEGITSGDKEITFEYCMISNDLAFIGLDSSGNETEEESDIVAYTVSGIGGCNNPYLAIPREHNGKAVTQIKGNAFYKNYNIKKVVIPESITSVEDRAFHECSNLIQANVNANKLGAQTFYKCSSLEKVTIEKNVPSCGSSTFLWCNKLNDLTILSEMLNINNDILGTGSALKEIKINEDNGKYKSVNGIVYSKDGTTIYAYPTGKEGDTYEFSSNIKTVGEYAFNGCKIKYIDIPESVTSVEDRAFQGCSNLIQANVNANKLGAQTFYKCSSLEKVTIGENLSSWGGSIFLGCNKLTSINYKGSIAMWNNTLGKPNWKYGNSSIKTIYCNDGEINL